MRCRVVICADCCTRVDGVNHCHACLKVLGARRDEARRGPNLGPLAAVLFAGLGWFILFGFFWLTQGMLAP
jgi:hypothetical protein